MTKKDSAPAKSAPAKSAPDSEARYASLRRFNLNMGFLHLI